MSALTTNQDRFELNGKPFQIISGAMHYFRIHPEQWQDRIRKARLMGLNTIETYVPWNLHQPVPGSIRLDGQLDLLRYLRLAQEEGLRVILRPGPYICAEWDSGGIPAWLTAKDDIRIRSSDPRFTGAVDQYFDLLISRIIPYMASSGGPIIAVQIENEYGAYGNDSAYLEHLRRAVRMRGVEELLFTCDQADPEHLKAGSLPGILSTVTFGGNVAESFRRLRVHQPEGPLMCSEFWVGWYDRWGQHHHVRDVADVTASLDALLAVGASVNIYMFHGGTNFGFTNGANQWTNYSPIITSYDYDAPLTESGDPGPKYHAFRKVIARYAPIPEEPEPAPSRKVKPITVTFDCTVPLLPNITKLASPVSATTPMTMDDFPQRAGFLLYRTILPHDGDGILRIADGVGDRAQIFIDGAPAGILENEYGETDLALNIPRCGAQLDILVENLGRVHYGPSICDAKGLRGTVSLNDVALNGWECYPLTLEDLTGVNSLTPNATAAGTPTFHLGTFTVDVPADAFLALPDWTKGLAWINGFNLGRYWNRGPQKTLYVPQPILQVGENTLVLLELHDTTAPRAHLVESADLGPTTSRDL